MATNECMLVLTVLLAYVAELAMSFFKMKALYSLELLELRVGQQLSNVALQHQRQCLQRRGLRHLCLDLRIHLEATVCVARGEGLNMSREGCSFVRIGLRKVGARRKVEEAKQKRVLCTGHSRRASQTIVSLFLLLASHSHPSHT